MANPKKSESLGAAECARRTGLTVRALRVYERYGLIEPRRTAKGWRCYGPRELQRLNVIVTLKAFGMSLEQIGTLVAKRPPPLARVLQMQLEACRARRDALEKSLELIRAALHTIGSGKSLSLEELCNLTRSMEMENRSDLFASVREQMNEKLSPDEERAFMNWFAARPAEERQTIQEEYAPAMRGLFRSLRGLREKAVDPAAAEVQALIVESNELAVRYGTRKFRAEMFEWDPSVARKLAEVSERALSRSMPHHPGAYFRAAQAASPWHRALTPIVDEAAKLAAENAAPSSATAQALAHRLALICSAHSLGDPLVYARSEAAAQFRGTTDVNTKMTGARVYLASAVQAAALGSR
jgi:DNA-binding transcriptional MerR regulator